MARKKKAPAVDESGSEVMLSVRVPEKLRAKARKHGIDERVTLQVVVIRALDEYLKNRGA